MTSTESPDGAVLRVAASDGAPAVAEAVGEIDVRSMVVGSTGIESIEPLVIATRDGRSAFHTNCSPAQAAGVASNLADGERATDADATVDHDPRATALPLGPEVLAVGDRHVLGACGWHRPTSPEDHRAAGGFVDSDGNAVREAASDLRGRGWGDEAHDETLTEQWAIAREAAGTPAVVVNAHGTAADRLLLESAPFEALEGAVLAARAVEADTITVYLSEADTRAATRVREAAANYPDPNVAIEVVTGPPAYRAGEPTMALEAIEGNHRLEARLRPPGPAAVGLDGRPTLVHTARTMAQLAVGARDEGFEATRLVTVAGDVRAPATVELAEHTRLDAALDAVSVAGEFKAACVGGRFGGLADSLDVQADPDALVRADLGTEGTIEVLAGNRCVLEFVGKRAQFAEDTNCGRCVPCREGTTQLTELLRDVYDGEYEPAKIEELVRVMDGTSICEFGVNAGRPVRTAIAGFESEIEAHADGECPAGSCLQSIGVTH
jgi:NADH-quinone oxidoreductase subunit F